MEASRDDDAPGDDEERSLVRAAQRGSADAAEALVRRHWSSAYRTAYLVVDDAAAAEDVCQEAMLAALEAIGRVDAERPFAPWLHRIVVNRSLDWTRARRRRRESGAGQAERAQATDPGPAASDDLSAALSESLAALAPADRAIVVLRHLLDYDSSEIGAMLGMRPATVRTRLRRALESIRAALPGGAGSA